VGLPYGDPDELDRLAGVLRTRAADVRQRADEQVTRAQAAQWVSVSAEAYRDRLAGRHTEAYDTADSLERAADMLVVHAQEVRERIAAIARIEQAVTDWFGRRASEVADVVRSGVQRVLQGDLPWSGWPYTPQSLPPSGDRAWLDAGQFMRGKGVLE
jgi:hypothetical protein